MYEEQCVTLLISTIKVGTLVYGLYTLITILYKSLLLYYRRYYPGTFTSFITYTVLLSSIHF